MLLCVLLSCAGEWSSVLRAQGQTNAPRTQATRRIEAAPESDALVQRAMEQACAEREQDPQGSALIDEMQAKPSLPLRHPEVLAGAERAERLLPVAKILAAESLRRLLREHHLAEAPAQRAAFARLAGVRLIKPDMELRDNAAVIYREPRTIRFGTIFLAGLRSDEGMISVLAHELTHVADGAQGSLGELFRAVARRARRATQLHINTRRGEELTCDLVGALAVRAYIARTASVETLARRTARALEHNCVVRDHTDNTHLSPRSTMRAVLTLDSALARAITGDAGEPSVPPRARPRRAAHRIAPRTPR